MFIVLTCGCKSNILDDKFSLFTLLTEPSVLEVPSNRLLFMSKSDVVVIDTCCCCCARTAANKDDAPIIEKIK